MKHLTILKSAINLLVFFLVVSCSANHEELPTLTPALELTRTPQPESLAAVRNTETVQPTKQVPTPTATALEEMKTQEIILWHGLDNRGSLALDEIIRGYKLKNPDLRVQAMYVPYDDLLERYVQEVESGNGPDLLLGAGEWGTILYDRGVISAIPVQIIPELELDINPSAYKAIMYENIPIALPYAIDGIVMVRNTAIIPSAPETFEELVILSQDASKGRIIGAYLERGDLFAYGQLTACGGQMIFPNGYPGFNNSSGLCWFNLLEMFETAGPISFNSDDDLVRFKAGNIGLIFVGTWQLPGLQESLGDNIRIDPWPAYGESHLSGYVWTENIYISSLAERLEFDNALKFSQYFLSPEGQAAFAELGIIPATLYRDVRDPLVLQAVAALIDGTPYPVSPKFESYLEPMHEALLAVFEQGIAPSIALQAAEDKITNAIDDFSDEDRDF